MSLYLHPLRAGVGPVEIVAVIAACGLVMGLVRWLAMAEKRKFDNPLVCPRCGTPVEKSFPKCPDCGALLREVCERCGARFSIFDKHSCNV